MRCLSLCCVFVDCCFLFVVCHLFRVVVCVLFVVCGVGAYYVLCVVCNE